MTQLSPSAKEPQRPPVAGDQSKIIASLESYSPRLGESARLHALFLSGTSEERFHGWEEQLRLLGVRVVPGTRHY